MPCQHVKLPGGGTAIVCGPRQRVPKCKCGSGRGADLLCDWKTDEGKTCDAKICEACATKPAEDKDLCPAHAEAWKAWLASKRTPR